MLVLKALTYYSKTWMFASQAKENMVSAAIFSEDGSWKEA